MLNITKTVWYTATRPVEHSDELKQLCNIEEKITVDSSNINERIINDINQMSDAKISQNIFKDYYNINQMRMLVNFYNLCRANLESVKLNLKNNKNRKK